MNDFTIIRDDDLDVRFKGWRLGTSEEPHSETTSRWKRISIYKTESGTYIIHTEVYNKPFSDSSLVDICNNAGEVIYALRDEDQKLSVVAKSVIRESSLADTAIEYAAHQVIL